MRRAWACPAATNVPSGRSTRTKASSVPPLKSLRAAPPVQKAPVQFPGVEIAQQGEARTCLGRRCGPLRLALRLANDGESLVAAVVQVGDGPSAGPEAGIEPASGVEAEQWALSSELVALGALLVANDLAIRLEDQAVDGGVGQEACAP